MKWIAVMGLLGLLAACGADGEPETPKGDKTLSMSNSI